MLKLPTPLFSITWGIPVIPPKQERVKDQENGHPTSSAVSDRILIQDKMQLTLTPLDAAFATGPNEISTGNRRLNHQLASERKLVSVSLLQYFISRNSLIPFDFQEKNTKMIFFFVSLSSRSDKLTFHR